MIIAYSIIVGSAALLLAGYILLIRNRENWMISLFSSVLVANIGCLLEAVSINHTVAVVANDLAYLGAIVTMLSTLVLINKLCGFSQNKISLIVLISLAALMFIIVAIHPIFPYYYKETWIETTNGVTALKKSYGPLYLLYQFYILAYLGAMITTIVLSIKKHLIHSYKIATLLFLVASINVVVWRVQRWTGSMFNMLSISYIFGAFILLYLFWLMQDYVHEKSLASPEPVVIEKVIYIKKEDHNSTQNDSAERIVEFLNNLDNNIHLTETETKVLGMLLDELTRKEISQKLAVSENTVKSHVSHIYTKLGIKSREELRALFIQTDVAQ